MHGQQALFRGQPARMDGTLGWLVDLDLDLPVGLVHVDDVDGRTPHLGAECPRNGSPRIDQREFGWILADLIDPRLPHCHFENCCPESVEVVISPKHPLCIVLLGCALFTFDFKEDSTYLGIRCMPSYILDRAEL